MTDEVVRQEATELYRSLGGPFVGRERELAALRAGLDAASAGRGRLFLLVGEPGCSGAAATRARALPPFGPGSRSSGLTSARRTRSRWRRRWDPAPPTSCKSYRASGSGCRTSVHHRRWNFYGEPEVAVLADASTPTDDWQSCGTPTVDSTINNAVINNADMMYYVQVVFPAGTYSEALSLRAVRITYTYTKP